MNTLIEHDLMSLVKAAKLFLEEISEYIIVEMFNTSVRENSMIFAQTQSALQVFLTMECDCCSCNYMET